MDCGMKFIKYLLIAFNLIFFVVALILIGVGAAVEIKYRDVAQLSGNAISGAPILLLCVGVFILIISFFGCCGAYKENYCMVTTFAVFLVLMFILELSAGIAAFVLKNKIEGWMSKSVAEHIKDPKPSIMDVFAKVQRKFECCGGNNSDDWRKSEKYQAYVTNITATDYVPDSCCVTFKEGCGKNNTSELYEDGCVDKFEEYIKTNAGVIGGVGVGIAFVQLIGIMFACCLMRTIKKQYEVV